jgi:transcriptional regulator EpsA
MRLVHPQPEQPRRGTPNLAAMQGETPIPDAANEPSQQHLNDSEREALMLNIDVSLRVHTRPQLFSWVQGALHSLIPHEVLMCGLQEGRQSPMRVDNFSTAPVDGDKLNETFQQDVSLVPQLIKMWEENRCRSIVTETERGPFASGALARALAGVGASSVLAHGTHDASGDMMSFFVFAAKPGQLGPKQAYLADLIVPYLHAAWVRSLVTWPLDRASATKPAKAGLLTPREQQILQWIYHGKSNIEIGMILDISPLTVKNHVQKTLRKLNVLNRTQAVGKALALRIVNP